MIVINRTGVAGCYAGVRQGARLELRVDVGSQDSLDVISGDLFLESSPGSYHFHHSFQTTTLVLEEESTAQLLRGPIKVHRKNMPDIGRMDLRVPRQGDLVATYTLYELTQAGRQTAATLSFSLQKQSDSFRQVDVEMESVQGVPFPRPFRTSEHPDTPLHAQNRTLTLQTAYRAAGIDVNLTRGKETIPISEAGVDGRWSDEELHAAMVDHFERHRDTPQWALYLLLATEYVKPAVLGIMFDADPNNKDFHRQGAAVFYNHHSIAGAVGAEKDREYLFTIVHELGHAFNFLHSFQKGILETHGTLPRPDAMSWMNYPQLFPFGFAGPAGWNGSAQFWSKFNFVFDFDEIHHLRHDDRSEVIPGGMSFTAVGHLEERPFEPPTSGSGLHLNLWTPSVVEFLQQVEGDVRLRNDNGVAVPVPPSLDPAAGHLELLIRRPADPFPKVYQRFSRMCVKSATRELAPGAALYEEIAPSYGRRRWLIDEPGTYELQASLKMPDGRSVTSEVRRLRVLAPDRRCDRMAADFFCDDVGVYLGVEGSRCSQLRRAGAVLEKICHDAPQAVISKQIRVTNAVRDTRVFKDIASAKVVKPNRSEAAAKYLEAVGASGSTQKLKSREDISNLRLTRGLVTAAQGCVAEGNGAEATRILVLVDEFLRSVKAPATARTAAKNTVESMQTSEGD